MDFFRVPICALLHAERRSEVEVQRICSNINNFSFQIRLYSFHDACIKERMEEL